MSDLPAEAYQRRLQLAASVSGYFDFEYWLRANDTQVSGRAKSKHRCTIRLT